MKALTVYQPYASLIAVGAKQYETRSWATNYRGPIAIHAAIALPKMLRGVLDSQFVSAVQHALFSDCLHVDMWSNIGQLLPRGVIVATAELVECHKIVSKLTIGTPIEEVPNQAAFYVNDSRMSIQGNEFLFGDYTPGRFAWELANVKPLREPIPARGMQGLWNWDERSATNGKQ